MMLLTVTPAQCYLALIGHCNLKHKLKSQESDSEQARVGTYSGAVEVWKNYSCFLLVWVSDTDEELLHSTYYTQVSICGKVI